MKNGIHIHDIYICEKCEREIVKSDVDDEFISTICKKSCKIKQSLLTF
ncbi:hypothetical protein KHA80_10250 [Anaerobacillus sp. HL2]|nr:hypothetical protein KHA80_10250 [Anaerobacillus sp. HL2]